MSSIAGSSAAVEQTKSFRACIPAISTAVLGGALLWFTQTMEIEIRTANSDLGPKWWPTIIASLIILFSIVSIAQTVFGKPKPTESAESTQEGRRSLLWTCALLLAFMAAWPIVGFFPSSAALLVALAWVIGERSPIKIAIFTATTLGVLYVLFVLLLRIPL